MPFCCFEELSQFLYIFLNNVNLSHLFLPLPSNVHDLCQHLLTFIIVGLNHQVQFTHFLFCGEDVGSHCEQDCHFVIFVCTLKVSIAAQLIDCSLGEGRNLMICIEFVVFENNYWPEMPDYFIAKGRVN